MTSGNYVDVVYDKQRTPKTEYPAQLISYLVDRFALEAGTSLVELGCGRGDFLQAFSDTGFRCFGVDREQITMEDGSIELRVCDLASDRYPFDDESIDVIYHKSVIEHLYQPDHLIKESMRILKPGGKMIILTPDWHTQMKNFFEDVTHCRPYDVNALKDLLRMFKFTQIEVETFYQLPFVWKNPNAKILTWFMRRFLNVQSGRALADLTGVKFFRWAVELMVLGYAVKPE